ncbi:hypothetical protein TVAG_482090 [Trichomonas vaginalis G3]|uniref:Glycosyltransferase 61 catalytic domain-containing protein n=1 Tax=Trichomonas vaginalis (strain ATCC PRA-98 / G3) TaxID=412133 RepID=A2EBL8_TRIV3|nr:glycosyltransferase family [Trichomonas vaginalis G3]EAY09935.1 hypothetical protein TVAG_482090 [Trichomonas vaginalis G3]KAI5523073.1 glycosyltransferase family [Trichomonas vaginalis G3]|eukprot:XP_001322158.1 hypothetical protein [Trichomonas vaginalis G3]
MKSQFSNKCFFIFVYAVIIYTIQFHDISNPTFNIRHKYIEIDTNQQKNLVTIPFFQSESTHMTRLTRYLPMHYIDFVLVTENCNDSSLLNLKKPRCHIMKSTAYVGIYDHAFCSLDPQTQEYTLDMQPPYDQPLSRSRTTNDKSEIGVWFEETYHEWGHLIHDFLGSFTFIPEYVLEQGVVAPGPWSKAENAPEWLRLLKWNVTVFDGYTHLRRYVNQLYVVAPLMLADGVTTGGIPKLRERFDKLYNLSSIPATRYVVSNKYNRRTLTNFNELVESLKKNVSPPNGNQWEVYKLGNNLTNTMYEWATFKVLVSVAGSMMYNSVFMKSYTGMCLVFSNAMDIENMQLCICSKIFMAGVVHPKFIHEYKEYACDMERVVKHTKQVVEAVENRGWKDHEGLVQFFDPEKLKACPTDIINPTYVDQVIVEPIYEKDNWAH